MTGNDAGGKAAGQSRVGGYQVVAKLGQGGMGAVFKAVQLSIDRTVALKILPPRLAKNQEYVTRFFREARSAARLNHPNIVQAFDAGEADGYYYFAMEFVDGQPVANLLQAGNPLPERQALEIVRDIARALNYAHEAGIVHRDIKPANILLTSTGVPKLADLGLAREAGTTTSDVTQAGYAIGTPDYISPEQVRGEADIDGRSDVYSLGATLYHMLTGKPPFAGGTGNEVMAKHLAEPIPNVHKANPKVSHASARIIWKAMDKDRERRYKTAGEMAYDIERVLAGSAGAGVGPGAPAEAPPPPPPKATSGKRQVYIGGGVVAALLALVLAISVLSGPGDKPLPQPKPNGPTTSPKPARNQADEKLLKYLREWARKHPGEYLGNIRKYEANIPKIKDQVLRLRATDDLGALRREQKQAAERAFGDIRKKADALIRAGSYGAAAALFENLPKEFDGLLADPAGADARGLSRAAKRIARADELSRAGKPRPKASPGPTNSRGRASPTKAWRSWPS